jgi:hypothetical protein
MSEVIEILKGIRQDTSQIKTYLENIKKTQRNIHLSEWVNSNQVMEFLGIGKSMLHRLRTQGLLPYSKINGKYLYKGDDIKKLLSSNYSQNKSFEL